MKIAKITAVCALSMLLLVAQVAWADPITKCIPGIPIVEGGYDANNGEDHAAEAGLNEAAFAAGAVGSGVVAASLSGAGALSGYAGVASSVSMLGLGPVTTGVAGLMGSSATGAAATTLVTAAVGGPLVMGTIIVVGVGAAGYGLYYLGNKAVGWYKEQSQ